MRKNHKQWDVNDIALLIYAYRFKGLTYKQCATLFDVSYKSISGRMHTINNADSFGAKAKKRIDQAEQLAFKIKSGVAPDHRKHWDDRISKITNISYTYNGEAKEKPIEKKPEATVPSKEYKPLISFAIDTESVVAVIKAWKGQ